MTAAVVRFKDFFTREYGTAKADNGTGIKKNGSRTFPADRGKDFFPRIQDYPFL